MIRRRLVSAKMLMGLGRGENRWEITKPRKEGGNEVYAPNPSNPNLFTKNITNYCQFSPLCCLDLLLSNPIVCAKIAAPV